MLLAMALVFSALCFSASAAEYSDSSFLGTSQNITGILLEDDIDALPNAADSNYVTLFFYIILLDGSIAFSMCIFCL